MGIFQKSQITIAVFLCLAILFVSCDDRNYAIIETPMGNMRVLLYDETPQHRDNFIKLANEGYYDSLLFHRIIEGFMAQGGDPDSKFASANQRLGQGGPGYTIPAEIGAPHLKGALAAARLGGPSNPQKESSGSQFFIVQGSLSSDAMLDDVERRKNIKYNEAQRKLYKEQGGYPMLDGEYTVFGEVVEGLEVIDKLTSVETGMADRPEVDLRMKVYME